MSIQVDYVLIDGPSMAAQRPSGLDLGLKD